MNEFYKGYAIWTIHQHSKTGLIWVRLQWGVVVYDPVKQTSEIFKNDIITNSTIRQIIEDDKGNLWFGINNGSIVKWNFKFNVDIKPTER